MAHWTAQHHQRGPPPRLLDQAGVGVDPPELEHHHLHSGPHRADGVGQTLVLVIMLQVALLWGL